MPKQLENILWMAEELDFSCPAESRNEVRQTMKQFLEISANPALQHCLYRS
jgi:hypothetical protein